MANPACHCCFVDRLVIHFLAVPSQMFSKAAQLLSGPRGAALSWIERRLAEICSLGLFCGLWSFQLSLIGQTSCDPSRPLIVPSIRYHWLLLHFRCHDGALLNAVTSQQEGSVWTTRSLHVFMGSLQVPRLPLRPCLRTSAPHLPASSL